MEDKQYSDDNEYGYNVPIQDFQNNDYTIHQKVADELGLYSTTVSNPNYGPFNHYRRRFLVSPEPITWYQKLTSKFFGRN
jgi:hypothetical protein